MKANELRIGNYLNDRGGKTLRIDFFEYLENGFDCKFGQKIFLQGQEVHPMTEYTEYATPIPLTEEWLVKFGFEKDKSLFIVDKDKFHTISNLLGENISYPFIKSNHHEVKENFSFYGIKYVHQLQNLYFALTGEELTLNENE